MKLQEWVDRGNNMLSNYTSRWCCEIMDINEKQLRSMELEEIFHIRLAGNVARREIESFKRRNILKKGGEQIG